MQVLDPVCNMTIEDNEAVAASVYKGATYHFCSGSCKENFDKDPEAYAGKKASQAKPSEKGVMHTCPMHPEIRQSGPGDCPKCGMALEPLTVTAEEEEGNPELINMNRRFWASLVLSLPVVFIAMRHLIPGMTAIERIVPPDMMSFSSVSVVGNALRLRRAKLS